MIGNKNTNITQGRKPTTKPPRVEDFEELDKTNIEALVDYMKYVATASGITMGFYARSVNDYVSLISVNTGKLIVPVWVLNLRLSDGSL